MTFDIVGIREKTYTQANVCDMGKTDHLTKYQFKPGNILGGRTRGARSKLSELAVEMLRADFELHGAEVIQRVRERKPEVYLASVVSLLPRRAVIEHANPLGDLSDAEIDLIEQVLKADRARSVQQIEAHERDGAAVEVPPIAAAEPVEE